MTDFVARARELGPLVDSAADEAERERRVPKRVAEAMAAAGLYRVAAPVSVGGSESDPETQIRVIEAISEADGATGWALMIGIENTGILAGHLSAEAAQCVYADPTVILSGALNPLGRAQREQGGYRVNGQWPFASGVHNSHYFWGQCVLEGGAAEAPPQLIEVLVPAADFEILDTWHVTGLRGSGSHDVRMAEVFVPDAYTTSVFTRPPRESGPLFRIPTFSRLAYNKVGVATGVARAAIRHFAALASEKKPRASAVPLRERPAAQLAIANAERKLRASRAFVFDAVGEVRETIYAGGEATREQRASLQLACSHAAKTCVELVAPLVEAAGTSVNFESSRLGRCWRDVQVVPQHIMVSPQWIEAAGRTLLGVPSRSPFF